jgi:hypothetical protein
MVAIPFSQDRYLIVGEDGVSEDFKEMAKVECGLF